MWTAVLAAGRGRIAGIPSTKGPKTPLMVPILPEYRNECLSAAAAFHQRQGRSAEAQRLRVALAGTAR